jgi:hypothetical protein
MRGRGGLRADVPSFIFSRPRFTQACSPEMRMQSIQLHTGNNNLEVRCLGSRKD